MSFDVRPVAFVRSPRKDLSDDFWGAVEAEIVLEPGFSEEALFGLADFSHVEVMRGIRANARIGRWSESSRSAARRGRTGSASRVRQLLQSKAVCCACAGSMRSTARRCSM